MQGWKRPQVFCAHLPCYGDSVEDRCTEAGGGDLSSVTYLAKVQAGTKLQQSGPGLLPPPPQADVLSVACLS